MGMRGEEQWEGEIIEGHKESFRGDGYVRYLGCGHDFTRMQMSKLIKSTF